MVWLHWLRHLAVEVVIEEVAVTLLSGCKWRSGGGSADHGGGFRRGDGGQLACSGSVLWLHQLRHVTVEAVVEEVAVTLLSGCKWSSGGGSADGGGDIH